MRQPTIDPTAGQRARTIMASPSVAQSIPDPTDPRYGRLLRGRGEREDRAGTRRIVDPTNPEWGELPA